MATDEPESAGWIPVVSALAGAVLALLALRIRAHARRNGVGFLGAAAHLPSILAEDVIQVRTNAEQAIEDGRRAARRRRREVDRLLAEVDEEIGQHTHG